MLRFRKYRVFLIFAIVLTVLLFQVAKNSAWEATPSSLYQSLRSPHHEEPQSANKPKSKPRPKPNYEPIAKARPDEPKKGSGAVDAAVVGPEPATTSPPAPPPAAEPKKEKTIKIPQLKESDGNRGGYALPAPTEKPGKTNPEAAAEPSPADHRKPGGDVSESESDVMAQPSETVIHWKPVPEHFPVAEESIIPLPTGKPKAIPSVQYRFGAESEAAKQTREIRLAKVKAEAKRAWTGYKQYAWTHDEVKPVSKQPRDPFCGWAATMVDALDTLWIMGMKDEFDDAVKAVKEIDFTTTPYRSDIPVFETIIRYLGGLLAAYDVSGGPQGKYKSLLEKAEELAAILMGVFDTPNRMPVLYYNWNPLYASEPKRAPTGASVAELGSMSMEFTRLAQLTGKNKYYDAVARITDAFEEWQNRGTPVPGIFPERVDASGCNRTAQSILDAQAASASAKAQAEAAGDLGAPEGYEPKKQNSEKVSDDEKAPQKQNAEKKPHEEKVPKKQSTEKKPHEEKVPKKQSVEDGEGDDGLKKRSAYEAPPAIPGAFGGAVYQGARGRQDDSTESPPFDAAGKHREWDCVQQGLTSGNSGYDQFSMGGSQDSTYEYFPKQYLLLGGLVPKYRTMHEKVAKAVKKHLLYRPMIKDDRDILFSAKAYSSDGTDKKLSLEYEVTHLTCFLGGMFALGGKIFELPEDVEVGKKLADGCAWAYEAMPSGIMPEASQMVPCKDPKDCPFNETIWYDLLDPNASWRVDQMKDYENSMKIWEKEVADTRKAVAEAKQAEERRQKDAEAEKRRKKAAEEEKKRRPVNNTLPVQGSPDIKRRAVSVDSGLVSDKVKKLESELDLNMPTEVMNVGDSYGGIVGQIPLEELSLPPKPVIPMTHEEYVKSRIERDRLPPGMVNVMDKRYILR
jgi:mannosyl-oligosaccharide alpha-1,2-mannosidase